MDDFLYNVRTGNMRNMDKYHQRYDNNRYKQQNRQPNKDRRKGYTNYRSLSTDQFSALKDVLGKIAVNQERQTTAIEKIAASMEQLLKVPTALRPAAASEAPIEEIRAEETQSPSSGAQPLDRAEMVALIHKFRDEGLSYEKIADIFESRRIATLSGRGKWRGQTIYRLFYEG